MNNLSLKILIVVLCMQFHCKTIDYAYRHDISGKVTDSKGKEISGATVCKIESREENCSDRDLYIRSTDKNGNFQFIYSGLGPKPLAKIDWILKVKHPKYNPLIFEFSIEWTAFKNNPQFGYIKKDITLELK